MADDDTSPAGGLFPDADATATPAPAAPSEPAKRTRARKDSAPRTRARKIDDEPKTGGRPTKQAAESKELHRQLVETFTLIGGAIGMLGADGSPLQADGVEVMNRATKMADALALLADQNPTVRRALTGGMQGSAWIAVIGAFGGLGLAIAKNHEVLPPMLSDVVGGGGVGASPAAGGDGFASVAAALADLPPEQLADMMSAGLQAFAGPDAG